VFWPTLPPTKVWAFRKKQIGPNFPSHSLPRLWCNSVPPLSSSNITLLMAFYEAAGRCNTGLGTPPPPELPLTSSFIRLQEYS